MKNVINIHVDDKKVVLDQEILIGAQLKTAAAVPLEVILFQEVPNGPDIEIRNDETYTIKSGMRFFSENYKRSITIEIDNKEFTLENPNILGSELIKLVGLDSSEYKLLREVKNEADVVIDDNTLYHLENKDVFFSVIRGIQNGGKN